MTTITNIYSKCDKSGDNYIGMIKLTSTQSRVGKPDYITTGYKLKIEAATDIQNRINNANINLQNAINDFNDTKPDTNLAVKNQNYVNTWQETVNALNTELNNINNL